MILLGCLRKPIYHTTVPTCNVCLKLYKNWKTLSKCISILGQSVTWVDGQEMYNHVLKGHIVKVHYLMYVSHTISRFLLWGWWFTGTSYMQCDQTKLFVQSSACDWQTWSPLQNSIRIGAHFTNVMIPYKSNMRMPWKDGKEDTFSFSFVWSTHTFNAIMLMYIRMAFMERPHHDMCSSAVHGVLAQAS